MSENKKNISSNAILKHASEIIFIIDTKGIITYVTPSITHLNMKKQKIINNSILDLISDNDIKIMKDNIRTIINYPSKQKSFTVKPKLINDKTKTYWKITLINLLNDKQINGILVKLFELTDQENLKRIEEKNTQLQKQIKQHKTKESHLKKNKLQYELLIKHANEAICVAQDGVLKFVNPKLCSILQYSEEEMLFKSFIRFIHPDDQELVLKRYKDRLQ
jgi:PAS domain-containing protein